MNISISKLQGNVPVTVLHLDGKLDASSYTDVIAKAQEAYDGGARDLLLDFGKVSYLSSAGVMSLHTIALMFAGGSVASNSSGRPTFRSLSAQKDQEARKHVKLVDLQPAVDAVLDTVGLKNFFEVHANVESAVKSF
jgi:anti-anti-sigma regulatory factor